MAKLEIENTSKLYEIQAIIDSYGDLLTDEQGLAIMHYYQRTYYGKVGKDYSETKRRLAQQLVNQQIIFLQNESFDSKRYKAKLINKFGFDTWLSWIFGKIMLNFEVKSTKIKSLNGFAKEHFVDKNLKKFADCLKISVYSEKNTWEYDLLLAKINKVA